MRRSIGSSAEVTSQGLICFLYAEGERVVKIKNADILTHLESGGASIPCIDLPGAPDPSGEVVSTHRVPISELEVKIGEHSKLSPPCVGERMT